MAYLAVYHPVLFWLKALYDVMSLYTEAQGGGLTRSKGYQSAVQIRIFTLLVLERHFFKAEFSLL